MRFYFVGDVAAPWTLDAIVINEGGIDCMDQSPRDHHQNTCTKGVLSNVIDVSPCDTWRREEALIFIRRAKPMEIVVPSNGPRFHPFWEINGSDLIALVDGPRFSREFLFKNRCILSLYLNF